MIMMMMIIISHDRHLKSSYASRPHRQHCSNIPDEHLINAFIKERTIISDNIIKSVKTAVINDIHKRT